MQIIVKKHLNEVHLQSNNLKDEEKSRLVKKVNKLYRRKEGYWIDPYEGKSFFVKGLDSEELKVQLIKDETNCI